MGRDGERCFRKDKATAKGSSGARYSLDNWLDAALRAALAANARHRRHGDPSEAARKRGWADAVEKLLRLIDFFLAVCDPASGHGGRVHRGEALLQQPGGHRQPEGPEEAQSLSLQEGNRDLQLLLLQHHPGRQAQQTGGEGGAEGQGLVSRRRRTTAV